MTKRIVIIIGFGIIMGLFIALPILLRPYITPRPPMPTTWRKLHPGMTRAQIVALIGQLNEMRELKGFDSRSEDTTMIGHPCYWHLELRYDVSGTVTNAEVRFIDRSSSRFNSEPKTLF